MTKADLVSSIYCGDVVHQRFAPKQHRLHYQIFQVLLDLDHLKDDLSRLRLFSHNRFNLFGFYDRDHGPDQSDSGSAPLRERMIRLFSQNGLYQTGDRLFLLAMPRVLGFVFNPISLYFLQDSKGWVKAVVYEVNNTFGDRHSYVLPVHGTGSRIRQESSKRLHVSPFMDMDLGYQFDLTAPEDQFSLKIDLNRTEEDRSVTRMLFAGFQAKRFRLTDRKFLQLFLSMPLMTLGVVAGIHWEALCLFLKGLRLKPKPRTPRSSVSLSS